jgi:hypothetical protein
MNQMPVINLTKANLNEQQLAIACKILNHGHLRASKPVIRFEAKEADDKHSYRYKAFNLLDSSSAYVWRMVAFQVSPLSPHHCMPIMADVYLPIDDWDSRRQWTKYLDVIVDAIVNTVPKSEWHGISRWANALG